MLYPAGAPFGAPLARVLALAVGCALAAGRPAVGQVADPSTFQRLVEEYRHGDADRAVREVASWSPDRVTDEARRPSTATAWDKAAAALLLTEAGLESGTYGRFPPDLLFKSGAIREQGPHLAAAFRLIDDVFEQAESDHDPGLLEFCRRWYVVSFPYATDAPGGEFIRVVRHRFENAPEVATLLGAQAESRMGPYEGGFVEPGAFVSTSHGRFLTARAAEAERWYRRALASDPGFVRARLRLGRLLYRLDRADDARPELERALRDARAADDGYSGYLAALFLGQLHQDRGEVDAAAGAYRQAIAIYPNAQSARIALDFLVVATGPGPHELTIAREVFAEDPIDLSSTRDPWHAYARQSPVWDQAERLETMRAMVRE